MNSIELSLFSSRIEAVCDEMGAVLQRAAFSPNIRDRLDFSCAIFDPQGELCAQAAHIPVHLGSMAFAMANIVESQQWHEGDMVMVNDPFLGGTHLPDMTLIAPLFSQGVCCGFVVNRAHHADIGANTPGSMPVSTHLHEEGMVIPPTLLIRQGKLDEALLDSVSSNSSTGRGDFAAQISANRSGLRRLAELIAEMGIDEYLAAVEVLNDYAERLANNALAAIPSGRYSFADVMDDDGQGTKDIPIVATIKVSTGKVEVDFSGTATQVAGNINCPLSVAAAAVFYVFRCLMPAHTPACAGTFRDIRIHAAAGCLLNAQRPAAVAAGNVETSTRIVDVVMGALAKAIPQRIPAASHGSMNNLAMGARGGVHWDYYETMGGGMGGSQVSAGLSGVQTHMTNTRNTPVEVLEMNYPVRLLRYALREGSCGEGKYSGGEGLIREYAFLAPATVTLLSERRSHAPWGLQGGRPAQPGRNTLNGKSLPSKVCLEVMAGERLCIKSAGGGGWGHPDESK